MKKICFSLCLTGLSLLLASCGGVKYSKIMTQKLRQSLGSDFKEYQTFSYPTNNFGLITVYTPPAEQQKPKDEDFFCDMWNCLGVKDENVPVDAQEWLRMNGFAAVGDGGAISLTENEKNDFVVGVLLPEIFQVLKLSAGFNRKQITGTQLQFGGAHARKLRRSEMESFLNGLDSTNAMKSAYKQGRLLLIVADVVVDAMKVTIDVDRTTGQALAAELTGKVGKIFKNSKLELKLTSETDGQYTFEVSKPVIVMRLPKRQAPPGSLGTGSRGDDPDDEWKDWKTVKIQEPMLDQQ
jgi:hypothetical protein